MGVLTEVDNRLRNLGLNGLSVKQPNNRNHNKMLINSRQNPRHTFVRGDLRNKPFDNDNAEDESTVSNRKSKNAEAYLHIYSMGQRPQTRDIRIKQRTQNSTKNMIRRGESANTRHRKTLASNRKTSKLLPTQGQQVSLNNFVGTGSSPKMANVLFPS